MKWKFLCSFLVFISGTCVQAQDFTYEDLILIIQSKSITSMDALLPQLPAKFLSSYTLMRQSRSLQEANPLSPRVIMFGENAKLTCAFNGEITQRGFDTLECFQFRQKERKFDFRQIQFPTLKNELKKTSFSQSGHSVDGKTECASCHGGADPRPNWDSYRTWPGAYGSNDDALTDDRKDFQAFLANLAAHPRYRSLLKTEKLYGGRQNDVDYRPNFRFSELVVRMNALRTARLLETSGLPKWQQLAFVMSGLECSLTADQAAQIKKANLPYADDSDLVKIFAKVGVSSGSWTTRILNDAVHPDPSENLYDHQGGFDYLRENTSTAVLKDLAAPGDAPLADAFRRMIKYIEDGYSGESLLLIRQGNAMAPDLDNFGNPSINRRIICPRAQQIFVAEYLKNRNSM